MSSIGVDLSSNKIVVVEMSGSRRGFAINNAAMIRLKPGTILKGEIQDTKSLSKELTDTWKKSRFRGKRLIVGISTQRAIAKEIDIPTVNEKELQKSIKYQISDYLPISADNVIYDYYIMKREKNSSKVMLTGAIRSIVDKLVESFNNAKLKVDALDLNCFSLFRLINYTINFGNDKNNDKKNIICMFNFGWDVSILGIIKENELRKPRFSTVARKTIIDNLCKKIQKTEEECIKILDSFDFSTILDSDKESESKENTDNLENSSVNTRPVTEDAIKESIQKTTDKLINDIKLTIDSFLQDDSSSMIGSIVISGERIEGLERYITKKLKYNVERLNILDYFSIDSLKKKPMFKDKDKRDISDDLTIAVGLAIRGLI